jgi:hypothetical protein
VRAAYPGIGKALTLSLFAIPEPPELELIWPGYLNIKASCRLIKAALMRYGAAHSQRPGMKLFNTHKFFYTAATFSNYKKSCAFLIFKRPLFICTYIFSLLVYMYKKSKMGEFADDLVAHATSTSDDLFAFAVWI